MNSRRFAIRFPSNSFAAISGIASEKPLAVFQYQDLWKVLGPAQNEDIAVRATALAGPDIWIDPHYFGAFFLSGPLAQALKTAKLTPGLRLSRCRIVRDH